MHYHTHLVIQISSYRSAAFSCAAWKKGHLGQQQGWPELPSVAVAERPFATALSPHWKLLLLLLLLPALQTEDVVQSTHYMQLH